MFSSIQRVQGKVQTTKTTGESSDGKSNKMFFNPLADFVIVGSVNEADIGKKITMQESIFVNLPKWIQKTAPQENAVAEIVLSKGSLKVDTRTNEPMDENYPTSYWWNFKQKTDYRAMDQSVETPETELFKKDPTVSTEDVIEDLGFDPTITDLDDPKLVDRIIQSLNPFSASYSRQVSILWQVANYHALNDKQNLETPEGRNWTIRQFYRLSGRPFIDVKAEMESSSE